MVKTFLRGTLDQGLIPKTSPSVPEPSDRIYSPFLNPESLRLSHPVQDPPGAGPSTFFDPSTKDSVQGHGL